MDMRRLGLADGAFDGLWACASFLHVPRADAVPTLSEFRRVLRSGGVVHVSVHRGDGKKRGDGYDGDRRTFTLYRPDGLRERATEAGLAVESVTTDGEWVQLFVHTGYSRLFPPIATPVWRRSAINSESNNYEA